LLQICRRPSWIGAGCHRRGAEGVALAQIITQNRRRGCRAGAGHRWPVVVCSADILKGARAACGGLLVLIDARTPPRVPRWCAGGVRFYIYNKVETKYNLFINVKYSIKYEFILFFVWWYKNKYLSLHQIIKVSPPQMRHK
jgi:hypothetical protein